MTPNSFQKLSIPVRKLVGALPQVPWGSVFYEMDPRLVRVFAPRPEMQVVGKENGRQLVRFGPNREFWLPDSCKLDSDLWGEYLSVFWSHRVNRHYYLRYVRHFTPEAIILDCGAFCGFFVRLALEHGAKRILAIEPNPVMHDCLAMTFHDEIKAGTISFHYGALTQSASRLRFDSSESAPFGGAATSNGEKEISVEGFCLDDLIGRAGVSRLDFLKMDIEGFEIQALLGGSSIIQRFKPALSITTYHRCADFQMLRHWLRTIGYSRIRSSGVCRRSKDRPSDWRPVMIYAWD